LIDHHGTLLASVTCKVRLAIAIQIQPPSKDTMGYRAFPNCGADVFALPFDLAWKANIH
jgi:hypothetical protein